MNFDKYKRLTTHMVVNGKNTNTVTNKGKVTLDDLINRLTLLEDMIVCKRLIPKYKVVCDDGWYCVGEIDGHCLDYITQSATKEEAETKLKQLMGEFDND